MKKRLKNGAFVLFIFVVVILVLGRVLVTAQLKVRGGLEEEPVLIIKGGDLPSEELQPFPEAGVDMTEDELECVG